MAPSVARGSCLVALLALGAVAACDQGNGSLRGDWLEVVDCDELGESKRFEPFEMDLDFISVTEAGGTALIRMSGSAGSIAKADQLVVALAHADDLGGLLAAEGARTYTLTGRTSDETVLTLALMGRCRHTTQPLAAAGSITFHDYGWREGSRVRGEMAFDLVDQRSGAIVGQNFVGDFDFETINGTPYTPFEPSAY